MDLEMRIEGENVGKLLGDLRLPLEDSNMGECLLLCRTFQRHLCEVTCRSCLNSSPVCRITGNGIHWPSWLGCACLERLAPCVLQASWLEVGRPCKLGTHFFPFFFFLPPPPPPVCCVPAATGAGLVSAGASSPSTSILSSAVATCAAIADGSSIFSPAANLPSPSISLPTSACLSVLYFRHIPLLGS